MKIVAFGASTSSTSINQTLATYVAGLFKDAIDAEVTILKISDFKVPMFSEDMEKEVGKAEGAQAFLDALAPADLVVVSYAEHNGTYTAAYKNLFDWSTRIQRTVFQEKPVIYLATSPGANGAKNILESAVNSATHFGANVLASLSLPSFSENFDLEKNAVVNQEISAQLKSIVANALKALGSDSVS